MARTLVPGLLRPLRPLRAQAATLRGGRPGKFGSFRRSRLSLAAPAPLTRVNEARRKADRADGRGWRAEADRWRRGVGGRRSPRRRRPRPRRPAPRRHGRRSGSGVRTSATRVTPGDAKKIHAMEKLGNVLYVGGNFDQIAPEPATTEQQRGRRRGPAPPLRRRRHHRRLPAAVRAAAERPGLRPRARSCDRHAVRRRHLHHGERPERDRAGGARHHDRCAQGNATVPAQHRRCTRRLRPAPRRAPALRRWPVHQRRRGGQGPDRQALRRRRQPGRPGVPVVPAGGQGPVAVERRQQAHRGR